MASHVLDSNDRAASASATTLRARFSAWQDKRRRQAQIAQELSTYTQRDLCDLGISSGDIPEIIRGTYRR